MNPLLDAALDRLGREPDFLQLSPTSAATLPLERREMLDHDGHMTGLLQKYHGHSPLLEVLGLDRSADSYLREVLLKRAQDSAPLLYALLDARLSLLPPATTAELVAARQPLGQILMETATPRHIEVVGFVRAVPSPTFRQTIGTGQSLLYGRFITIHIEARPAITVLELLLEEMPASARKSLAPGEHPGV